LHIIYQAEITHPRPSGSIEFDCDNEKSISMALEK
jgi:hypothetical protein